MTMALLPFTYVKAVSDSTLCIINYPTTEYFSFGLYYNDDFSSHVGDLCVVQIQSQYSNFVSPSYTGYMRFSLSDVYVDGFPGTNFFASVAGEIDSSNPNYDFQALIEFSFVVPENLSSPINLVIGGRFTPVYYSGSNIPDFSIFSGSGSHYYRFADKSTFSFSYVDLSPDTSVTDNYIKDIRDSITEPNQSADLANQKNEELKQSISEYNVASDTSSQQQTISDSGVMNIDLNIFTTLTPTITFVGDAITLVYSALGDFAQPLVLVLSLAFLSAILLVVNHHM